MANIIDSIFRRKKVIYSKLEAFGFKKIGDAFFYQSTLPGSGFEMTVQITATAEVKAKVIDPVSGEPYALHLADGAVGSFVVGVRTAYEDILAEIAAACFEPEIFKSSQAKKIIEYVRETYGNELEYLWSKFPDNAVWRRKENGKWYGAILTVSRRKLGLKSDEVVEIIDLRYPPEKLEKLIDGKTYFPGWHMNKKNWYTIILDGSVPVQEICEKINQSYLLAIK